MTERVKQTVGLQKVYEDARTAQKAALTDLLLRLQEIRSSVECQVPDDHEKSLTDCFCDKLAESDESVPPPEAYVTCDAAEAFCTPADLERAKLEADKLKQSIVWVQGRLDDLVKLPAEVAAQVTALATEVTALEAAICDRTIEFSRAFVIQLQLRHRYVQLRRTLTDSRTYICTMYQHIDQLFCLFEKHVCVAGAIARLEKQFELEEARRAKARERLIDDVLICAAPDPGDLPPDEDKDQVDALEPCAQKDTKADQGKSSPYQQS